MDGMSPDERRAHLLAFTNEHGQLFGALDYHGRVRSIDGCTVREWMMAVLPLATAVRLWRAWQRRDTVALKAAASSTQFPCLPTTATAYRTFHATPTVENARGAIQELVS